ncbi:MAG: HepT-like ribonuclease domain-containing protein [Dehalococcoidia bacterium]
MRHADAVSHLFDDLKQRPPEIPWRSITDFRNRLAHGYLDVKPERVWDVIIRQLPILKYVVEAELARPHES